MIDDIEDDDEGVHSVIIKYGRATGECSASAGLASLIATTPGILEFVASECIWGSLRDGRVNPVVLGRDAAEWTVATKICGMWESRDHELRAEEFSTTVSVSDSKTVRDGIVAAIVSIVTEIPARTIGIGGELKVRISSSAKGGNVYPSDAGAMEHSAVVREDSSTRQQKLAAITAARFEGLYFIPDMEGWIWNHDAPGSPERLRSMMFALPAYMASIKSIPTESKKLECMAAALEASFRRNAFLSAVLAESGITIGHRLFTLDDASDRFAASLEKLMDAVCIAIDGTFPKNDRRTRSLAVSAIEDLSELGVVSGSRRSPEANGLRSMLSDIATGELKVDGSALLSSASKVISSAMREAAHLRDDAHGRNAILERASDLGIHVCKMVTEGDADISRRRRRLRTLASVARKSMF